ncbi:AMP-binding protein [Streptomyces sp. NPDC058000]|uniref:AMP-binding protein n=1 Tax=Streptomyces sp. NPDC058000 TaxID=3346299 RepID=UPI0036ECE279
MRTAGSVFEALREKIVDDIADGGTASFDFSWPELTEFNWASDWFDSAARGDQAPAVVWSGNDGVSQQISFEELRACSDRVAGWLVRQGVGRGTRILISLCEVAALWEIQLAALKLGAIVVPAPPMAAGAELMNVLAFSGATVVITDPDSAQDVRPASTWTGITVGGQVPGWSLYEESYSHAVRYRPRAIHQSRAPFLLECSGGSEEGSRLRGWLHSHYACAVGRLTDLYFTRLRPGQRYVTAAPPGSMEHLCFGFLGPLTAGATTVVMGQKENRTSVDVAARAHKEGAHSAYVSMAQLTDPDTATSVRQTPLSEVELLSSLTVESLARTDPGPCAPVVNGEVPATRGWPAKRAWPTTPGNVRWGMRHHQTSTGLMVRSSGEAGDADIRTTALPGHRVSVLSPTTGAPAEAGELWLGLSGWSDGSTPTTSLYGDAHRLPGVGALRTGLQGRRMPDGSVRLTADG